jgi:hypothetical protein
VMAFGTGGDARPPGITRDIRNLVLLGTVSGMPIEI